MKKWIFLIVIVLCVVGALPIILKQNTKPYTGGNMFFPGLPGSNSKPTPTISFATRQQCANDANMLMIRIYQQEANTEKQAESEGQTLQQIDYSLSVSTFSNKLNSCVATVHEDGIYNSQPLHVEQIYDTISGEMLAQIDDSDSSANFIPNKYKSVSNFDYINYKSSIGL